MKCRFLIAIGLSICLSSCAKNKMIQEEMERFYGQRVALPTDSMWYITAGGSEQTHNGLVENHKYVVYYDSTECSSCQLKTLSKWGSLIDTVSSSKHKVDFYFIFSVPTNRMEDIRVTLDTHLRSFPVYLDTTGVFERMNPCLPRLSQLRTFMLDGKGFVELVGNPVGNSRVADMMWNIIKGEDK